MVLIPICELELITVFKITFVKHANQFLKAYLVK